MALGQSMSRRALPAFAWWSSPVTRIYSTVQASAPVVQAPARRPFSVSSTRAELLIQTAQIFPFTVSNTPLAQADGACEGGPEPVRLLPSGGLRRHPHGNHGDNLNFVTVVA